ncbi:MAG: helix-turn-helix transcriptional regulator [Alphaproteobacteria bacterium]|nr:helix-turn-helix transcriptional regulator [Alphaproteobacteria bacterium]
METESPTAPKPIFAAFDLIGRRSALRILWSIRKGPLSFRALEAEADTNPATLSARLAELREAGLVELSGGYRLTKTGNEFVALLKDWRPWAKKWAAQGREG